MRTDGLINLAFRCTWPPAHQRQVLLRDRVVLELVRQMPLRRTIFRWFGSICRLCFHNSIADCLADSSRRMLFSYRAINKSARAFIAVVFFPFRRTAASYAFSAASF